MMHPVLRETDFAQSMSASCQVLSDGGLANGKVRRRQLSTESAGAF